MTILCAVPGCPGLALDHSVCRTHCDCAGCSPEPTDRCVKCGGPDGFHDPACVVHPMDRQPSDSRETCPEWNCPDLSSEDLREGKTCPDHPCTCPTEGEQSAGE